MHALILSKYPPIEGGIAAKAYWLSKGLAEAGIEITVITNSSLVEEEYRIQNIDIQQAIVKNLEVYSVESKTPWHIPNSDHAETRLLNLFLDLHNAREFDLIDSGYLVPYGIVAYLANQIASIPYIVRHGGSDLEKFLDHPEYRFLLKRAIAEANLVITDKDTEKALSKLSDNVLIQPTYIPDEHIFKPEQRRQGVAPTFAYIGKVNHHWRRRGLDKIVELFKALGKENSRLLFVAQGIGLKDFKNTLSKDMLEQIIFKPFVPPWEMPKLLASVDYVFSFAVDDPMEDPSNLVLEALAAGTEVITNRKLPAGEGVHQLDLSNMSSCAGYISRLIQDFEQKDKASTIRDSDKESSYISYIKENIQAYEHVIANASQ